MPDRSHMAVAYHPETWKRPKKHESLYRNLIRQLIRAVLATCVAYFAARYIYNATSHSKTTSVSSLVPVSSRTSNVQLVELDVDTLAAQAFARGSFSIHPRAISRNIVQRVELEECLPERNPVLMITMWLEDEVPGYVKQSLASLARNTMFDVLFVTTSLELCGSLSSISEFIQDESHVKLICLKASELQVLIMDGLCSQWHCNGIDAADVFAKIRTRYKSDPTFFTHGLQSLYRTTFRQQISKCYDRWAWSRLDHLHGDYRRMFPLELAWQFDVVTVADYVSRHDIYLRPALAILQTSIPIFEYLSSSWLFKDQYAFIGKFSHYHMDRYLKSFDQGPFSKALFRGTNVRVIQFTGLLNNVLSLPPKFEVRQFGQLPNQPLLLIREDTSTLDQDAITYIYNETLLASAFEQHDGFNVSEEDLIPLDKGIKPKCDQISFIPNDGDRLCTWYFTQERTHPGQVPIIFTSSKFTETTNGPRIPKGAISDFKPPVYELPFPGSNGRHAVECMIYDLGDAASQYPLNRALQANETIRMGRQRVSIHTEQAKHFGRDYTL